MNEYENSWKSESVFEKQLRLNKTEFRYATPTHITSIIRMLRLINPKNMLDVGCGCGGITQYLNRDLPNITYTGIDYSLDAVSIARREFGPKYNFECLNYNELNDSYSTHYDLLSACGLHSVLSNGDEALEFLLTLGFKNIVLGKIGLTSEPSNFSTYIAYDEITTYCFKHNKELLINLFNNYNYMFIEDVLDMTASNFLLRKNNV